MDIKVLVVLFSFFWITVYMLFINYKYGIQKSVSESYYRLKEDNIGWIFTVILFLVAYPLGVIASNIWITPAAMLICLVGVARSFKDSKGLMITHLIGAIGGISFAIIGIWIHYKMWYLSCLFVVLYLTLSFIPITNSKVLLFIRRTKTTWIELLALIFIYIVLIINI